MILALLRRLLTFLRVAGKGQYLTYGVGLHVGKGSLIWAPSLITIGRNVYIGKHVNIEANCEIGDNCLIANRVAIVGRHDHDYRAVGYPMRFAPWIGSKKIQSPYLHERTVINEDVWLGYGAIVLTGTTIGRGCVIAAGSVVSKDIPPYSIAAGVPARVIDKRFESADVIRTHETKIRSGRFAFSERGYDHCTVLLPSEDENRP